MDLDLSTKTNDSEKETPPHHLSKKSKSNGSISQLPPTVISLPSAEAVQASVEFIKFNECLKNHAANLGGHALDGCGEFLPSPNSNPTEPTSLTCAACGCHRNFHRRDPENPTTHVPTNFLDFHRRCSSPSPSQSPPPLTARHMLMALQTSDTVNLQPPHHYGVVTPVTPRGNKSESSIGRKRFRTKFSQDQKEKMLELAEKLGWKMQKNDDVLIEKMCDEIGISRGVYKVWLHNNKSTLGKKNQMVIHGQDQLQPQPQIEIDGDDHVHDHPHVNINGGSSSSS